MTRPKLTSREDLLCALHRAVVEVSTLQAAEMKLTYSSRPDMPNSTEMADLIRQVEIKIMRGEKSDMRIELAYPNNEAKSLILKGMEAVEEADPKLEGLREVFEDSPETKDQVEALEQDMYPADEQAEGQEVRGNANAMPDEAAILDELRRSVKEEESPGSSPVALATTTSPPPRPPLDESFLTLPLTDPKVKFAVSTTPILLFSQPANPHNLDPQTRNPTILELNPRPRPPAHNLPFPTSGPAPHRLRPKSQIRLRSPDVFSPLIFSIPTHQPPTHHHPPPQPQHQSPQGDEGPAPRAPPERENLREAPDTD
jgi:hypothetical protein